MKSAYFGISGVILFCFLVVQTSQLFAQKIETAAGVRIVVNTGPLWGDEPKVELEPVTQIGSRNSKYFTYRFDRPTDFTLDSEGNVYVLDTYNHRVQKFDPDGNYLATIGRPGEGVDALHQPAMIEVDPDGNIYVTQNRNEQHDASHIQVYSPQGRYVRTIPDNSFLGGAQIRFTSSGNILKLVNSSINSPFSNIIYSLGSRSTTINPVIRIRGSASSGATLLFDYISLDESTVKPGQRQSFESSLVFEEFDTEGNKVREINRPEEPEIPQFKINLQDKYFAFYGNSFTIDSHGNTILIQRNTNLIEKRNPDGDLIFRSYHAVDTTESKEEIKTEDQREPVNSIISVSYWISSQQSSIITFVGNNSLYKNSRTIDVDAEGRIWVLRTTREETQQEKMTGAVETDIFVLDVYDSGGIYLGVVPLNHYAGSIRIHNDRLYVFDPEREVTVFAYKIVDK